LAQLSVPPSQVSTVQPMPSSQSGGVPATQSEAKVHRSGPLQKLPSSQSASDGALTQPPAPSSQLSTVQVSPSSHEGGTPGRQPSVRSQSS